MGLYKQALSIKRATGQYDELKNRFYEYSAHPEEWRPSQEDVEEAKKLYSRRDLDHDLAERQRLLTQLENYVGWNRDNEPKEFGDLLRRVRQMRDDAMFARYLPDKGPLDIDKVPRRYAIELQNSLPLDKFLTTLLPRKDRWLPYRSGDFDEDLYLSFNRNDVMSGRYGDALKRMYEAGSLKTQGDWKQALMNNIGTLPEEERKALREWLSRRSKMRKGVTGGI